MRADDNAALLRSIVNLMVERNVPNDLAHQLHTTFIGVRQQLEDLDPVDRSDDVRLLDTTSKSGWPVHSPRCWVSGSESPVGLAADVERNGSSVVASVEIGASFEGAPGIAHGGVVAAIFDDVLAYAAAMDRGHVVTHELTVRFLAPTPTGRTLVLEGAAVDPDGRRISVSGRMRDGATILAEGSAVFVMAGRSEFSDATEEDR